MSQVNSRYRHSDDPPHLTSTATEHRCSGSVVRIHLARRPGSRETPSDHLVTMSFRLLSVYGMHADDSPTMALRSHTCPHHTSLHICGGIWRSTHSLLSISVTFTRSDSEDAAYPIESSRVTSKRGGEPRDVTLRDGSSGFPPVLSVMVMHRLTCIHDRNV